MVLTWRGWAVAGGGLVLATAGRLLGVPELFVLAAGCVGLVVAGIVSVLGRPLDLQATRRLVPPRVHAGTDIRVELSVLNRGARTTPVVTLRDFLVDQTSTDSAVRRARARFLVAPLRPGQEDRASYRLTMPRRGRYLLGPLEVHRGDAFGLVSTARLVAAATEVTVYPRVEVVAPLPSGYGSTASGTHLPTTAVASGEDFYGLREYQVGDDMRRVHWPSTARLDELMIRQLELPWQGRATVVLDARGRVHTEESMELAVSAAASLAVASWRQGSLVRLVTTDGVDSGFAHGPAHLEAILEQLALVEPSSVDELTSALRGLHGPGDRGGLAIVSTSAATAEDLARFASLRNHGDRLAVVLVAQPGDASPVVPPPALSGAVLTRISSSTSLGPAWNRELAGSLATPSRGA